MLLNPNNNWFKTFTENFGDNLQEEKVELFVMLQTYNFSCSLEQWGRHIFDNKWGGPKIMLGGFNCFFCAKLYNICIYVFCYSSLIIL